MAKELSEGQAWKHIVDLFGDESVFHPEEVQKVDIIRTGSPSLDSAITIGGWPRGRLIQLAGKESSGKTFMAMMAMARWQSLDPENCVAFLDAEYTYDPVWAKTLGIDNDRVFLVKSNAAGDIFTGLVGKVKKNKQTGKVTKIPGLLDMIERGMTITHKVDGRTITLNLAKMGVIVLDSIAAMETPTESASDVGKQNIALMARFLSTELKKLRPLIAKANVAMIAINQVRVNVGQMFGNPEGTSGGRALKHACSLMIEVAPISGADNVLIDEQGNKIGHKVRAKISKNKLGPPARRAEFFNNFTSGVVNTGEELLDLGVAWGMIVRPNNRSYIINDETLTSRAMAIEYVEENATEIEQSIRSIYLNQGKVDDSAIQEPVEETVLNNPFMDE
jgi:recombination protein RecA